MKENFNNSNNEHSSEKISIDDLVADNSYQSHLARNNRRKIYLWVVFSSLIVFVVLIIGLVTALLFFRVEYIIIEGNDFYSIEEIIQASGISNGDNMIFMNRRQIAESLTRSLPYIYSVQFVVSLPNSLHIIIVEDTPLFYFMLSDRYVVISSGLKVLEIFTSGDVNIDLIDQLPRLTMPSLNVVNIGEVLQFSDTPSPLFIVNLLNAIVNSPFSGQVSEIDVSNRFDIHMMYDQRWQIRFGSREDFDIKLRFAAEISSRFIPTATGVILVDNIHDGRAIPDRDDYFIR